MFVKQERVEWNEEGGEWLNVFAPAETQKSTSFLYLTLDLPPPPLFQVSLVM